MLRTLALSTTLSCSLSVAAAATEPPSTTAPTTEPTTAPTTTTLAAAATTEPTKPRWSAGLRLPSLLGVSPFLDASAGVELRLTDAVWLTVDVRAGASHVGGDFVDDTEAFASARVGARWFVVDDGVVRPSLHASAGPGLGGLSSEAVHQFAWTANAGGGFDVDVFVVDDAVSLRVGADLVDVAYSRVAPNDGNSGGDAVSALVSFEPAAALQVYF